MTEDIFKAGEMIDAVNKKLVTNLKNSLYRRTEDPLCEKTAKLFIDNHTKKIIDIVKYEQETVKHGKCCYTCAIKPESKECLELEKIDGIDVNKCDRPEFKNWQPRINKATLGLEE